MIKKGISSLILATVVLTVLFFVGSEPVEANQSIQEIESELKQIENEKSSINNDLNELNNQLKELESQMAEKENEVANLNNQIDKTEIEVRTKELEIAHTETEIRQLETEIKKTEEEIANLEEEIEYLEEEIVKTEERLKQREEILVDRLRSLQKNGGSVQYLEVILGAKSFSEFISRTSAVNKLMDQDQKIIHEFFADKEYLEETKVQVEESKDEVIAKKDSLEENKSEIEAQRDRLVAQRSELNQLISNLENKRQEQFIVLASLEEEADHMHDVRLSLEQEEKLLAQRTRILEEARKKEEERQRQQAQQGQNSQVSNSSGFINPTTGRITSHFNPNRVHPISGQVRPHNGIDIANPEGTPIYAAASGTVYQTYTDCVRYSSRCSGGSLGNAIFISHVIDGQVFDTVYGHLHTVNVVPGQYVEQGQLIGTMGTTGGSTGPHLHFEIHRGGYFNPINPYSYIY